MKKLFLISVLFLMWSGSAYSEIINLNNCYYNKSLKDKTWNKKSSEKSNYNFAIFFICKSRRY